MIHLQHMVNIISNPKMYKNNNSDRTTTNYLFCRFS